jgi:hypothetical protein
MAKVAQCTVTKEEETSPLKAEGHLKDIFYTNDEAR